MQLKDTNLPQLLGNLGLTYNESQVYLYLVSSGETVGHVIYSDLKMDKSSCYRALNSLISKNLVNAIGEERNRIYKATPLQALDDLITTQEKKILQVKTSLIDIKDTLTAYMNSKYKNKHITVINNSEGYNRYLLARLDCKSKLIRDMSGRVNAAVFFDDYDKVMQEYINKRVKEGIFLRQLSHPAEIDNIWDITSSDLKKEVRLLPKDFNTDAVFSAWDDKSAFFSKEAGKVIGVEIEDQLITNVLISMFDFIWEHVTKHKN